MKADDLRAEVVRNVERFSGRLDSNSLMILMQYGAMMEVAAQLAELNEKLGHIQLTGIKQT